jgi:hypothetical protein
MKRSGSRLLLKPGEELLRILAQALSLLARSESRVVWHGIAIIG